MPSSDVALGNWVFTELPKASTLQNIEVLVTFNQKTIYSETT